MDIYYFSSTGNSLAVARDLAERTDGRLLSIPSLMDCASIIPETNAIGLVSPVYHKSIPLILKRFVEKLEGLDGTYIFATCTYGDTIGLAISHLDHLLQSRGGRLAAGFGVHLPYNYLTPPPTFKDFFNSFNSFTLREIPLEKQQALFAEAREKTVRVAAFVDTRRSGTFELTSDVLTRLADRFHLEETLGKTVWLKVASVEAPSDLPFMESRQAMDRGFWADEKCNGCGICTRICPVGNISMNEGKPVWQQHCEQCFACLQWCPQEALQFGSKTAEGKRYHHPEIKLADMLKQADHESNTNTRMPSGERRP
ncbi:MAG: EFR1 family ferrodoxin [Anaerolineae bacterium]|nr:EFR1 family ferrodoxin [Anaerolineae bacterium]